MERLTVDLLTNDERARFERDGFITLPGRARSDDARRNTGGPGRAQAAYQSEPAVGPHHGLNLHDLIGRDDAWLDLVDRPTTFAKVWGVLGWNIQLFHTQLLVTPPAPERAGRGAYGWHQDNNRMNLDLETDPQPRVSVKVGYFLTDLPETDMGNLTVVPGSHRAGRPDVAFGDQPDGATEVLAEAGDAILFDRRLWHAASTNASDRTRIFVTYGYSYRWLRPKSAMQHTSLFERVDPIRRQLLGWCSSANGYFEPTDDDVPLRTWIRDHVSDAAVAP